MKDKKIIAVVLLALAVRMLLLLFAYPSWQHGFLETDAAKIFMQGHGFSVPLDDGTGIIRYVPTAHDMPGYVILLALSHWITGSDRLIFIQIFQILLDCLAVFLIYSFGRRLISEKAAVIGAILFAIYLPEAYLAVSPMRDVWVSLGVIAGFALFLKYCQTGQKQWLLLVGIILGLSCYFRPAALFLPIFLAVYVAFKKGLRESLMVGVFMQVCLFACLLPWVIRNYFVFDRIIPTRSVVYQSLWEGFGEFDNPFGAVLSDELTMSQMKSGGYSGPPNGPQYDEFIKAKAFAAIEKHPWWYVGTVIRRVPYALLINRVPWGILQDQNLSFHKAYLGNEGKKSLLGYAKKMADSNPGFLVTKVFDSVIFLLASIGAYLTRRQWREVLLLLIIPFYFMLIHIPIHIEGRYMVPSHWIYLLFMAVALERLYARFVKEDKSPPQPHDASSQ